MNAEDRALVETAAAGTVVEVKLTRELTATRPIFPICTKELLVPSQMRSVRSTIRSPIHSPRPREIPKKALNMEVKTRLATSSQKLGRVPKQKSTKITIGMIAVTSGRMV